MVHFLWSVTTQQKPLYPALTTSRPRPQISLIALLFGRAESIGNSLFSLTVDLELNWKQELQLCFCLHLRGLWQKMATVCYGAAMSSGLWEEESNDCTVLFCFFRPSCHKNVTNKTHSCIICTCPCHYFWDVPPCFRFRLFQKKKIRKGKPEE